MALNLMVEFWQDLASTQESTSAAWPEIENTAVAKLRDIFHTDTVGLTRLQILQNNSEPYGCAKKLELASQR